MVLSALFNMFYLFFESFDVVISVSFLYFTHSFSFFLSHKTGLVDNVSKFGKQSNCLERLGWYNILFYQEQVAQQWSE